MCYNGRVDRLKEKDTESEERVLCESTGEEQHEGVQGRKQVRVRAAEGEASL